jgi:hypothetical protein
MMRTAGFLCLCFWLLAISGPALAGRCMVPTIHTLDNQTVQGTMYATSGKHCGIILLRSRGPIHSTRVITQASHGNVSVQGSRLVYVSRPGYVGDDHFVYAKEGFDPMNRPVTRTVEVTVKVAEKW